MKRFLSTFGICLALVEAFLFFGGYQLFDFSRRWYLAGASIALVLAVLVVWALIAMVLPQLLESITTIIGNFPSY